MGKCAPVFRRGRIENRRLDRLGRVVDPVPRAATGRRNLAAGPPKSHASPPPRIRHRGGERMSLTTPGGIDRVKSLAHAFGVSHGAFPFDGGLAQLGERLNGIQKVVGSSPISSTRKPKPKARRSNTRCVGLFRWQNAWRVSPIALLSGRRKAKNESRRKSECRSMKDPGSSCPNAACQPILSSFGFRHSFVIVISSFVIPLGVPQALCGE
jgi:hypothetical protein